MIQVRCMRHCWRWTDWVCVQCNIGINKLSTRYTLSMHRHPPGTIPPPPPSDEAANGPSPMSPPHPSAGPLRAREPMSIKAFYYRRSVESSILPLVAIASLYSQHLSAAGETYWSAAIQCEPLRIISGREGLPYSCPTIIPLAQNASFCRRGVTIWYS